MIKFNNKTYNLLIIFFYYSILLLILERYLCFSNGLYWESFYNNPNYLSLCKDLAFDFWGENKLIENFQVIFLLLSLIYFFVIIKKLKNNFFMYYYFVVCFIGMFYFLGEEISWGQHFFQWNSPNFFISHNNQNETNLHNMSNLFNEVPRYLVLFFCCFSPFSVLFFKKFFINKKSISFLLLPNPKILIICASLIFFTIPDLILSKLDLEIYFQRITFNFLRVSELQELIVAFYFFIYSSSINECLNKKRYNYFFRF
tara:strand:- start:1144 stop:1914 length:771 start_codon:yes stop_codon:yes gene_type:complete